MSKINFVKRHYKAFLLFSGLCIVFLSLGFNMVILPWYDKQQLKAKEKQLEPLGASYRRFGYVSGSEDWYTAFGDMQAGSPATPATNGYAKSISARVGCDGNTKMKCALYNNATNAYIATTEEKTVNTGGSRIFVTFNFSTPVAIYSSINYLIACWSDVAGGTYTRFSYTAVAQNGIKYVRQDTNDYSANPWSNPWVNSGTNKVTYYEIYCTYDRSPTQTNPAPANNSINVALTPKCNITVNDPDGNTMTLDWYYNTSAAPTTWISFGHNASVANGTYRQTASFATTNSQKYYWKCYVNDGIVNVSTWYYFTTVAGSTHVTPTSLFTSTLTGGNTTTIYRSLWTSSLTAGNISTGFVSLFTSLLTGGNISALKPNSLFTSTLTGGNISSFKATSLFTSLLTAGNISTNSNFFTSILTGGNISNERELFTSLLTAGNISTKFVSLFTSLLTGGNISLDNWTSLWTSNLSGGNVSSNHSFFTSLLSGGNITHPVSLWTSLLTGGNTSVLTPATPFNPNLYLINPNPGNGTHNTNYLKSNASGLTTSIDIFYKNFTTPSALTPGTHNLIIIGTPPANEPTIWNTSAIYNTVWDTHNGIITPGNLYAGQASVPVYLIARSFLLFDASFLPTGTIINSAYVQLVIMNDYSVDDFNVTIQETKPPIPHDPLIINDYQRHAFAGQFGHTNTTGYADGNYFNISLNSVGLAAISNTSMTYFGIRSDQDINASAPTDNEFMIFYSYGALFPSYYPKLIINCTIPESDWQNIVNVTWYWKNSTSAWSQYYISHVDSNGTVTVPALNFSGIDTYFWHLEWESNHTNNGSSQVFTFTTVNASSGIGTGNIIIASDRKFVVGLVIGGLLFFVFSMVLWKRKNENTND